MKRFCNVSASETPRGCHVVSGRKAPSVAIPCKRSTDALAKKLGTIDDIIGRWTGDLNYKRIANLDSLLEVGEVPSRYDPEVEANRWPGAMTECKVLRMWDLSGKLIAAAD